MYANGGGKTKVSRVQWNYPPVWSPDGTKIVFAYNGAIWEYTLLTNSLEKAADVGTFVQHPSYSADAETIVFSDGTNIWAVQEGQVRQLTSGEGERVYPMLP
jgi:Tol biopolymer transport system component